MKTLLPKNEELLNLRIVRYFSFSAILLFLLLLILAACGNSSPTSLASPPTPTNVSSATTNAASASLTPPSPTTTLTPSLLPNCDKQAAAMSVYLSRSDKGLALAGDWLFTNKAEPNCQLARPTSFKLIDGHGNVFQTTTESNNNQTNPIVLQQSQQVGLFLVWKNWCGRGQNQPNPKYGIRLQFNFADNPASEAVLITDPSGDSFIQPPNCIDATASSTLYVAPTFETSPGTYLTATAAVDVKTAIVGKETAIAEATKTAIAQPTATPTPTLSANTPFCQASDLTLTDGLQGATGSIMGGLIFTNTSSHSCYLDDYPQVQLQNGNGQILPLDYANFCLPCTDPNSTSQQRQATVTALGQQKIVLQPNEQAIVTVVWRNWCGKTDLSGLQFVVTLPHNAGKLTTPAYNVARQVPLDIAPRCDAPDAGSSLSIGSFQYT